MRFIKWESDLHGNLAYVKESATSKAIAHTDSYNFSVPSATYLIRSLMHELDLISAEFENDQLYVYNRLACVSVLDDEEMIFYALYGSGTPNYYCVRKALWKKSDGNIDVVIDNLNAKTIFFNDINLNHSVKSVINLIDGPIKNYSKFDTSGINHDMFINKDIYYFISDDSEELVYKSKRNVIDNKLEMLFCGIELIYSTLNTHNSMKALSESFRVSYSFKTIAIWLDSVASVGCAK